MAALQAPLWGRGTGVLRSAGSVTVGAVTPRRFNPLLQKDDVGKSRGTCYDLPDSEVPYGRPGNSDIEGAREVSMNWVSHAPSQRPRDHAPDWVTHNKRAAVSKVMNGKDMKHFRRERDLLDGGQHGGSVRSGSQTARDLIPSDVVPGFTYGRKVRPSTPISEVIANRSGEQAEQDLKRFYTDFHDAQDQMRTRVRKIPLTAASRGHGTVARQMAMRPDEDKELFKLSKFKRAAPKVETRHRRHLMVHRDDASEMSDDFGDVERSMKGRGMTSNDFAAVDGAEYYETTMDEGMGKGGEWV